VTPPELSVVVASHERPLRLRFLLNALAEQTAPRDLWEVIVVHDSGGPETEELLGGHELARAGVLGHERLRAGSALAPVQRNHGWRAARAPMVAFTDDDCRPPPTWVARALEAARRHPGAVVQGATRPDPDEAWMLLASQHARSQDVEPPTPWAETCNILYPRAVLEALDGFEDSPPPTTGEDADLAARARGAGYRLVGDPELLTFHAVDVPGPLARLRFVRRWRDLPRMVRRHPELRRELFLGFFWKPTHAELALALAGVGLARRRPAALALVWPYAWRATSHYGRGPRGLARSLAELPGRVVYDLAETVAIAAGAIRHREPML